jgi:hypothetical protein
MKSSESILLTSVYLPAKGSKNHLTEYKEAIDQLYELHFGTPHLSDCAENNQFPMIPVLVS